MSKVRDDLVGTVHAVNQAREKRILKAGDKIPEGFFVGGHVVENGDPNDQIPPWATPHAVASVEVTQLEQAGAPALVDVLDGLVADGAEPREVLTLVATHFGIDLDAERENSDDGKTADVAPLVVPPKAGAGSGVDAWRTYAAEAVKRAGLNIEFDASASRGDIIAALDDAKIATE